MSIDSLGTGLCNCFIVSDAQTRSISPENFSGEKGCGGKASSKLGVSRKGNPFILDIKRNETVILADIDGPGIIQHIWLTVSCKAKQDLILRDCILRFYWDEEEKPSVEVPIGDFFCNGFATYYPVNSFAIVVNPAFGYNCYFPMPFRKKARITIENQHENSIHILAYQINYSLVSEIPDNCAYFHAQWRRENPTSLRRDYTILENVRGRGHYIGTFLAWNALEKHWWGEGEMKFYIDGDKEWPTICGTGVEDYFGGAWSFGEDLGEFQYNTPFLGYPLNSKCFRSGEKNANLNAMYRWHFPDAVRFASDLRVTVQQLGHDRDALFERSDDISSVAYWYQIEPHGDFPELLPVHKRWPNSASFD